MHTGTHSAKNNASGGWECRRGLRKIMRRQNIYWRKCQDLPKKILWKTQKGFCLLYTSDAADD